MAAGLHHRFAWLRAIFANARVCLPSRFWRSVAACRIQTRRERRQGSYAGQPTRCARTIARPARAGRGAEFQAKLGTAAEEADECLDWLEYFRDGRIRCDPLLIEEARELTKILAASMKTSRANTKRMKKLPSS
jgi:four helix bundle protein